MNKIILFTSNIEGGIVQFTITVLYHLTELNYDVLCFLPSEANVTINDDFQSKIIFYKKEKSLFSFNHNNYLIKKQIIKEKPFIFWSTDSSIISLQIIRLLPKTIKKVVTLHDGLEIHPTYNNNLKSAFHQKYHDYLFKISSFRTDKYLFLSDYTFSVFKNKHKSFFSKMTMFKLGPHIPPSNELQPIELNDCRIYDNYLLFFGRIDKYKGLKNFFYFFNSFVQTHKEVKLIVAGKGSFSAEESQYLESNNSIIAINRFIDDAEMIYLFKNCRAVVLPYIEATQSGVIPIAYYFKKPVIVSNVPGLTQMVINGKTGYICDDKYGDAIENIYTESIYNNLCLDSRKYYEDNLNMKDNIQNWLLNLFGFDNN